MRVQSEHGDARRFDAQVALQRLVEDAQLLYDSVLSNSIGHLADRKVCRYQSHTQRAVHQHHQGLLTFAHTGLNVFGVSGELELLTLDGVFVDRCGYQHINQSGTVVDDGTLQRHQGRLSALLGRLAQVDFHFFLDAGHQIHLSVNGILGLVYGQEIGIQVERLAVERRNLGGTVDDGGAQIQHTSLLKNLQDHFVAHSVYISLCDSHTNFSILHNQ